MVDPAIQHNRWWFDLCDNFDVGGNASDAGITRFCAGGVGGKQDWSDTDWAQIKTGRISLIARMVFSLYIRTDMPSRE